MILENVNNIKNNIIYSKVDFIQMCNTIANMVDFCEYRAYQLSSAEYSMQVKNTEYYDSVADVLKNVGGHISCIFRDILNIQHDVYHDVMSPIATHDYFSYIHEDINFRNYESLYIRYMNNIEVLDKFYSVLVNDSNNAYLLSNYEDIKTSLAKLAICL